MSVYHYDEINTKVHQVNCCFVLADEDACRLRPHQSRVHSACVAVSRYHVTMTATSGEPADSRWIPTYPLWDVVTVYSTRKTRFHPLCLTAEKPISTRHTSCPTRMPHRHSFHFRRKWYQCQVGSDSRRRPSCRRTSVVPVSTAAST